MLGYIDWINGKGGISGRRIEATSNDYAYKVPTAEGLYKKYVSGSAIAIQGWGTGDSESLRTKVASDKLPIMSASYAEVLTDPKQSPYNFVVAPTYSDQMRVALNWIAKDAGGPAEVAVFHNDSPFGTAPIGDGQKWLTEKKLGLTMSAYPMPKTPNFVGLLSQAKAKNAKYVVIQNVSSPAAQVAKEMCIRDRGGVTVPLNRLLVVLIAGAVLAGFALFYSRSRHGVAMRAVADDQQAALTMGISVARVFALAWVLAAVSALVAGVLLADLAAVEQNIAAFGLIVFPVVILGCLDSIPCLLYTSRCV